MNITDLLESGQNISITVSAKDLKRFAEQLVHSAKCQLERTVIDGTLETLLTTEQVAAKLCTSRMTLYRWAEKGYLKPIEVGGEKRYLLSDIQKIIKQNEEKQPQE